MHKKEAHANRLRDFLGLQNEMLEQRSAVSAPLNAKIDRQSSEKDRGQHFWLIAPKALRNSTSDNRCTR